MLISSFTGLNPLANMICYHPRFDGIDTPPVEETAGTTEADPPPLKETRTKRQSRSSRPKTAHSAGRFGKRYVALEQAPKQVSKPTTRGKKNEPEKDKPHTCLITVPGTTQRFHLVVSEEEMTRFKTEFGQVSAKLTKDGVPLAPITAALQIRSLPLDSVPQMARMDYRKLNQEQLVHLTVYVLALLILNAEHGFFIGIKLSIDSLLLELSIRQKLLKKELKRHEQSPDLQRLVSLEKRLKKRYLTAIHKQHGIADIEQQTFRDTSLYGDESIYTVPEAFLAEESEASRESLTAFQKAVLYLRNIPLTEVIEVFAVELQEGNETHIVYEIVSGRFVRVQQQPKSVGKKKAKAKKKTSATKAIPTRWKTRSLLCCPETYYWLAEHPFQFSVSGKDIRHNPHLFDLYTMRIVPVASTTHAFMIGMPRAYTRAGSFDKNIGKAIAEIAKHFFTLRKPLDSMSFDLTDDFFPIENLAKNNIENMPTVELIKVATAVLVYMFAYVGYQNKIPLLANFTPVDLAFELKKRYMTDPDHELAQQAQVCYAAFERINLLFSVNPYAHLAYL